MTDKDKPKKPGAAKATGRKPGAKPGGKSAPRSASFGGDGPRRGDKPFAGKDGSKGSYAAKGGSDVQKRKPRPQDGDAPRAKTSRPKAADAPVASAVNDEPQRISKVLARAGVASRRDIERMISEGRITLNGKLLDTPVVNITPSDEVLVDGEPVRGPERTRLWLYHKPAGLVTTNSDPEGRPTVFENLPEELPRVLSIGRLDINTEGLLLLTNDGGLARVLELPTTGWLRRYRVRAHGEIDQAELDKLKEGIAVDGVLYGAIDATLDRTQGSNVWLTMGLREGKNREIKNVLGALGLDVNRLIRISYGPFQLGDLPEGGVQEVRGRMLRDQLGPRLIDEAKANFDAPIYNDGTDSFDGRPAREGDDTRPSGRDDWKKEAFSDRPQRRMDKGERREEGRARLDTRPARGGKDFGARGDDRRDGKRDERRDDRPARVPAKRARTANVWMAPGARPIAEKTEKDGSEEPIIRREDDRPRGKRYGKSADGKTNRTGAKFDPDRKAERQARADAARPVIHRDEDDSDWIRSADRPQRRDERDGERGGERGRGPRRDFGGSGDRDARGPHRSEGRDERPARGDGERGSFSKGPRSFGDRADGGSKRFVDRDSKPGFGGRDGKPSFGKGPGKGRSFGSSADGEGGGRASSGKSFGKPGFSKGPRAGGDRPSGDRPSGDRSGGKGGFGGKGPGAKGPGGRPGGNRSGGRPGGNGPRGGRGA
ncbi:23S rRNA pseudouridine2605 synthase [Rhizobium sp. RU20A]|uniref:pseudouridine synthase n=1 Tax=Rhizobium sp. RU20A TaxID=1907412 RepID=UPI0009555697|nr:pseudouridine synthase [Rhizobium sp. RU20A]SIR07225.1 23S rRNA pseudouridine2605 synthase [Rhizobium sp. RU20A]